MIRYSGIRLAIFPLLVCVIGWLFLLSLDAVAVFERLANISTDKEKTLTMHFSLDDTINIFKELSHASYESAFQQETLRQLRRLHDSYGAVFSLYCYYSDGSSFDLSQMDERYADEFSRNSSWLRFSFHAYSPNDDENSSAEQEVKMYELTMGELRRITGGALDTYARFHRFRGSQNVINILSRHSDYPLEGLYTADDLRESYGLSLAEQVLVRKCGRCLIRGVIYQRTDLRIERGNSSSLDVLFLTNRGGCEAIEIFTHEWYLSPDVFRCIEMYFAELGELGYRPSFGRGLRERVGEEKNP